MIASIVWRRSSGLLERYDLNLRHFLKRFEDLPQIKKYMVLQEDQQQKLINLKTMNLKTSFAQGPLYVKVMNHSLLLKQLAMKSG